MVCGFNFGAAYGPAADGLIHVHHLNPLSEIGAEYVVDPVVHWDKRYTLVITRTISYDYTL